MRIVSVFMAAILIASCAMQTASKKEFADGEALSQRAALYWEAKKKNDLNALKDMVDPEIRNDIFPYLDSLAKKPVIAETIAFRIEDVKIEGRDAAVATKVSVRVTHPMLGPPQVFEQAVRDKWVKRGGFWYVIIVKPDLKKLLERYSGNGGRDSKQKKVDK